MCVSSDVWPLLLLLINLSFLLVPSSMHEVKPLIHEQLSNFGGKTVVISIIEQGTGNEVLFQDTINLSSLGDYNSLYLDVGARYYLLFSWWAACVLTFFVLVFVGILLSNRCCRSQHLADELAFQYVLPNDGRKVNRASPKLFVIGTSILGLAFISLIFVQGDFSNDLLTQQVYSYLKFAIPIMSVLLLTALRFQVRSIDFNSYEIPVHMRTMSEGSSYSDYVHKILENLFETAGIQRINDPVFVHQDGLLGQDFYPLEEK